MSLDFSCTFLFGGFTVFKNNAKIQILPLSLLFIYQAANQNAAYRLSVFCHWMDVTPFPEGRAHFTNSVPQT